MNNGKNTQFPVYTDYNKPVLFFRMLFVFKFFCAVN